MSINVETEAPIDDNDNEPEMYSEAYWAAQREQWRIQREQQQEKDQKAYDEEKEAMKQEYEAAIIKGLSFPDEIVGLIIEMCTIREVSFIKIDTTQLTDDEKESVAEWKVVPCYLKGKCQFGDMLELPGAEYMHGVYFVAFDDTSLVPPHPELQVPTEITQHMTNAVEAYKLFAAKKCYQPMIIVPVSGHEHFLRHRMFGNLPHDLELPKDWQFYILRNDEDERFTNKSFGVIFGSGENRMCTSHQIKEKYIAGMPDSPFDENEVYTKLDGPTLLNDLKTECEMSQKPKCIVYFTVQESSMAEHASSIFPKYWSCDEDEPVHGALIPLAKEEVDPNGTHKLMHYLQAYYMVGPMEEAEQIMAKMIQNWGEPGLKNEKHFVLSCKCVIGNAPAQWSKSLKDEWQVKHEAIMAKLYPEDEQKESGEAVVLPEYWGFVQRGDAPSADGISDIFVVVGPHQKMKDLEDWLQAHKKNDAGDLEWQFFTPFAAYKKIVFGDCVVSM